MTGSASEAERLRELARLRQVRDRMDREYAQPDRLHFWWSRGEVRDGDPERASLHEVATVDVPYE